MLQVKFHRRLSVSIIAIVIAGLFFSSCTELPPGPGYEGEVRDYVITPGHDTLQPFNDITAVELTSQIKVGWNLGNTFDAHGNSAVGFNWLGGGVYANTTVPEMEAAWVGRVTTKANIDTIKNAGFNAIRIPVTWYKAVNKDFIIREDWLKRVTEVVNWAEANDMYIFINSHHDEEIFKYTDGNVNISLARFGRLWEQIAVQFQNYNEKLIFEALNEPRTIGAAHQWTGGNNEERANLNKHYQLFVDTVRASGGNNDKRILMVNTYAASAEQVAINGLTVPADIAPNKIIVSIHSYAPFLYAHEVPGDPTWEPRASDITTVMIRAYNAFVSKGIPVIMGEFGSRREKDGPIRDAWAEFYVSSAREYGIPCILWDDHGWFRLLERSTNTFNSDSYLAALMRGAGIE
ncbi:MAG: glycoside hydrolase family 5 protein [Treponema sp.]|nr:glycoside hydrolase family 5 protein [Treponema sp.]